MGGHDTWEDYARARRAGHHSAEYQRNRRRVLSRRPLYCALCDRPLDPGRYRHPHDLSATVDHIVEISEGGDPTAESNMQPSHRVCNLEKERRRRARLEGRTVRPRGAVLPGRAVSVVDVDAWVIEEDP